MKRKDPHFKPLDKGLFQFPDNKTSDIENPSLGDIFQDPLTGTPYLYSGSDFQHGGWSPFASQGWVNSLIGGQGGINSAIAVTGRVMFVDKDNPNSTDTRTGVSKYSTGTPFKTIQAAIPLYTNGDILVVRRATTNYTESLNFDPSAATAFIIILDGAGLDGGANSAIKCTKSTWFYIFLNNTAIIQNTGQTAAKETTACIDVIGYLHLINESNLTGYVQGNQSYCIKTTTNPVYCYNIQFNAPSQEVFHANCYVTARNCDIHPAGQKIITGGLKTMILNNCIVYGTINLSNGGSVQAFGCRFRATVANNIIGNFSTSATFVLYNNIFRAANTCVDITGTGNITLDMVGNELGLSAAGSGNVVNLYGNTTTSTLNVMRNSFGAAFNATGFSRVTTDIPTTNYFFNNIGFLFPVNNVSF